MQREFVNSLFTGKEASLNRGIMNELLSGEPLNHYTLSRRLETGYSTVHGRVIALSKRGILEKTGEKPGTKNKQPTALWTLSPLGLWAAAHVTNESAKKGSKKAREKRDREIREIRRNSLEKCRTAISGHWKEFTDVYELDKVKTSEPLYEWFTKWLESNKGVLDFLDAFGAYPLAGRAGALGIFRRMIDLALLRLRGAMIEMLPAFGVEQFHGEWLMPADPRNPYRALAEIASKHEKFRRLDGIMQEVDIPLYDYLEKAAHEDLVEKLKLPLGEETARKLAVTPFFIDQSQVAVSSDNLSLLSANAFIDIGARIWIEPDRVTIETDDPDKISSEWKDYCDLNVISARTLKYTRIPARKSSR